MGTPTSRLTAFRVSPRIRRRTTSCFRTAVHRFRVPERPCQVGPFFPVHTHLLEHHPKPSFVSKEIGGSSRPRSLEASALGRAGRTASPQTGSRRRTLCKPVQPRAFELHTWHLPEDLIQQVPAPYNRTSSFPLKGSKPCKTISLQQGRHFFSNVILDRCDFHYYFRGSR